MDRFEMIKKSDEELKAKIAAEAEEKEMEKMSKRMTGDEKKVLMDDIKRMFEKEGYSDQAVSDFVYKEHAIEVKPSGVAALRKTMGLKQQRGAGKVSKKVTKVKASPVTGGSFDELEAAFDDFVLMFNEYREKRLKILESL